MIWCYINKDGDGSKNIWEGKFVQSHAIKFEILKDRKTKLLNILGHWRERERQPHFSWWIKEVEYRELQDIFKPKYITLTFWNKEL